MKRPTRPALDPDAIVRTALDVLDEVGLDELSMRRLAEALGVQNPALYWHVKNKQELLDRMAEVLLSEGLVSFDAARPTTALRSLERFAHVLRATMRLRKDGARLLAAANLTQPGSAVLARVDALLASLIAEGVRARDALAGILTVVHYTLGATVEEQSDPRQGDATMPAALSSRMVAAFAELRGKDSGSSIEDARFELGVRLIVEGLRTRRRPARGAPLTRPKETS